MSATPICALSDLPVDQCACRVHKPATAVEWSGIAALFLARFDSTLDCGHHLSDEGETTVCRTADCEYICEECADA